MLHKYDISTFSYSTIIVYTVNNHVCVIYNIIVKVMLCCGDDDSSLK